MDPKEKQEKHETKKICNNATSKKSGGRHGGKHTEKNVPYTRTGDAGTSVLLTGERRSKDDIAFEAMGTVDELCSIVGTVHSELTCEPRDGITQHYGELEIWLLDIMSRLFDIGSHVAKPRKSVIVSEDDEDKEEGEQFQADGIGNGFDIEHTHILEDLVDIMTDKLPELTSFILPTGSKAAAQLHVARCVCRRAERRVLPLVKDGVCDPNAVKYLNRLSDFFFTAARYVNFCDGQSEFQYRRHTRGARQRNRVAIDLREEKKSE
jgi:cob(I)alamin adenosyltransferase